SEPGLLSLRSIRRAGRPRGNDLHVQVTGPEFRILPLLPLVPLDRRPILRRLGGESLHVNVLATDPVGAGLPLEEQLPASVDYDLGGLVRHRLDRDAAE